MPEDEPRDAEVQERLIVEAMLKIKEPARLIKRIAERHEQLAKLLSKDDTKVDTPAPTAKELIAAVTLGKVTVDGDSATAIRPRRQSRWMRPRRTFSRECAARQSFGGSAIVGSAISIRGDVRIA